MKYFYFLCLVFLYSCGNNKYYIKSKSGINEYYCIKKHRDDDLRLLIFRKGIPHYSYTKIYANENGEVIKIIIEKNSEKFYQVITDFKDNQYFFNKTVIEFIDTIEIKTDLLKREFIYKQTIKPLLSNTFCGDLKFPKMIGVVPIERPNDYLKHFEHRAMLKQKIEKSNSK